MTLDYTWALPSTLLGNAFHFRNLFWPTDPVYRDDLSYRQNRNVYQFGYTSKGGDFAVTLGNVITNAAAGGSDVNLELVKQHEELHIGQERFFGPVMIATQMLWPLGGFVAGTAVWPTDTSEDWNSRSSPRPTTTIRSSTGPTRTTAIGRRPGRIQTWPGRNCFTVQRHNLRIRRFAGFGL